MKRRKSTILQMIPVVIVMFMIGLLSVMIYQETIDTEKENCWGELEMATHDIQREISIRFADNYSMLDLAADAIVLKVDWTRDDTVLKYLSAVQQKTFFDRIDIMFPDGRLLLQNGTYVSDDGRLSYQQLLEKEAHLSSRTYDPIIDGEALYYFTPVVSNETIEAILVGTVSCKTLSDLFVSSHYADSAQLFLIDRRDGNILLDKWHKILGSIYDMGSRKLLEEFEGVDFISAVMNGATDQVAFISQTTDQPTYASYMPVDDLAFSVAMFVPGEVIFKDMLVLQNRLRFAGLVELLLLMGYVLWNVLIVRASVRNDERARLAELERDKNEAKTRFLSSISHDIRTPINGIVGMLDVIRLRGNVPEHLEDSLHKINVSAKYLLSLTNDVLDLNELESGKIVFDDEPFDLRTLSNDVSIIMEPRASERGVGYHMDCSKLQHPCVRGSEVHINKILLNLIGNAIKYNKENGEVFVSIEDLNTKDEKGMYQFTVRDTGIGMSEEFQKDMFAAFEQEHSGARTGHTGHGLGLSIVSRLVEKMGGTISVDSKKDVGSTFVVTLPLNIDTDAAATEPHSEETANLTDANILLVEDNDLNMEIADVMLTASGAHVTHAANGRIAVEQFQASQPYAFDVILMDIMMPEIDGHEATRMIRAMDRPDAKTVPIIAMTASTFSEDIQRCRESGMNEHIGKPLDMNTVIVKISKHL